MSESGITELVRADELSRLSAIVASEHEKAIGALCAALRHAIAAGDALREARRIVPDGEWLSWLAGRTFIAYGTAWRYMRLSEFQHDLPRIDGLSLTDAAAYLRGRSTDENASMSRTAYPVEVRVEALRLRESEGLTNQEIADLLGIKSASTISLWADPERQDRARERERQRRADAREAKRLLHRKRRDSAVRQAGGDASRAYAHLRKCLAHLDKAIDDAQGVEEAALLRQASDALYSAEDDLVKAMRVDAPMPRRRS